MHTSFPIVIPAQAGIQGRSIQEPAFEETPLDSRLRAWALTQGATAQKSTCHSARSGAQRSGVAESTRRFLRNRCMDSATSRGMTGVNFLKLAPMRLRGNDEVKNLTLRAYGSPMGKKGIEAVCSDSPRPKEDFTLNAKRSTPNGFVHCAMDNRNERH
jgi:hypothetical protein